MSKRVLCGVLLLVTTVLWANVTITWDKWPYGRRSIGGYTKWWMSTSSGSHVTVPAFNSSDSVWDLVSLGGSQADQDAESYIMPKDSAQGSPPSIATYSEKQVFNGQTSWGYEGMDTTGGTQYMWLYGIYAQSTEADYDPPYDQVYQFPMQLNNHWTSQWTWNIAEVDTVYETRDNTVVAQGKVRVPGDTLDWYPCVVIQTYSTSNDQLGQISESRIIHEWDVPDMGQVGGSVATIQSQNNETDPGFTDACQIFKQKQFHSVFDNEPPTFANTTVIPSGYYYLGPFYISSRITDQSGVVKDSIYYKIGSAAWVAAGHDSMRNSTYRFHIPLLPGSDTVSYYLCASDNSPAHNRGTDPAGAPGNVYRFYAKDPSGDHFPPQITGTTQVNDTPFTGPFAISTNVTDSCSVDSAYLLYRVNSGPETPVQPDSVRGSAYYLTIPSQVLNTFIRYRIRAVDGSPNHNADYDPASGYYSFNVIDAQGPSFDSTTQWPDTTYPGPFLVQSQITDISGVQWARLFFKLGSAGWDSLPSDSSSGSRWSFHIPEVTSPMSVRYYLEAADSSQRHNIAFDPPAAPTTYYSFYDTPSGGIAGPDALARYWRLGLTTVNPREVELTLPVSGNLKIAVFDASGSLVRVVARSMAHAGSFTFALPGNLAAGTYLMEIQAQDKRLVRHFAIVR